MIPRGYDPDRDQIACPECGAELDADYAEITTLAQRDPEFVLCQLACPVGRTHDLDAAYEALKIVRIAHADSSEHGYCTVNALVRWRGLGWYPTDPEHQTPTEMVHERVRLLQAGLPL